VKLPECVQRKFSSVFSETPANYEAFCQMRIKIKPSAYTKKYRFNIKDDKKG
jgi:hypothetical protein